MTDSTTRSPLDHFIRQVESGYQPHARPAEESALALARCVATHACGLDSAGLTGLIAYLRMAHARPGLARELIKAGAA